MNVVAPPCSCCGGIFVCAGCERTLRKQLAMRDGDSTGMDAGASRGVHSSYGEATTNLIYASRFPVGERGGALIDFGRAIVLECFAPYVNDTSGETIPFCPMPFHGDRVIHDIGRMKDIHPTHLENCQSGMCRCDSRPSGWLLTRPIIRALLGCTDSYLNDHGRQLPGLIGGSWQLAWDTVTFMTQCYFNSEFVTPTRAASRAARADRSRTRSAAGCGHEHPTPGSRRRRG